jgi:hypothetical protein
MERTGHDAAGGDYGVRPILTPGKVVAPGPTNASSSIEVIEPLDNILAQGHVEGRLRSACYLAGANGFNRFEKCFTETFSLSGIPAAIESHGIDLCGVLRQ